MPSTLRLSEDILIMALRQLVGGAHPMPNVLQISTLQQLLYENARAKSSEDIKVVNKLRRLQSQFVQVYFGDK